VLGRACAESGVARRSAEESGETHNLSVIKKRNHSTA